MTLTRTHLAGVQRGMTGLPWRLWTQASHDPTQMSDSRRPPFADHLPNLRWLTQATAPVAHGVM